MRLLWISALTIFATASASASLLVNGDFETGTLLGWAFFTTGNGSNGPGLPNVVSFDTTGDGATFAAHFNVGEVDFTSGDQEGGGLFQDVTLAPGVYTFSAAIAAQQGNDVSNGEAGVFTVLLDGVPQDQVDLGDIPLESTLRSTLSATLNVETAGLHEIRIEITRPFAGGTAQTPDQFLDNITLEVASPEPSTLIFVGLGLAGVAGFRRMRSRAICR